MPSHTHRAGTFGEALVVRILKSWGWVILAQRARVHGVEIDVVARDGRCLHIVEVKFRRGAETEAETWLTDTQRERLCRAADSLAQQHDLPVSLDLALVEVTQTGSWLLSVIEDFVQA